MLNLNKHTKRDVGRISLLTFFLVYMLIVFKWEVKPSIAAFFAPETITVYASNLVPDPSSVQAENADEVESGVEYEPKTDLERLVWTYFGDKTPEAMAIARAESGLNPERENISPVECSIGLFQINLAKDHCNGTWVHAKKVPGETMAEKIEWLKNPSNNAEIAYKIQKASGWWPWSVFKNGTYLQFLEQ